MKKNIVIAALAVGMTGLLVRHVQLIQENIDLINLHEKNRELVELATRATVEARFQDIVKNFDN